MAAILNNPALLALIGTIIGTIGLELLRSWLAKAKEHAAQEQSIRDELRKELDNLRALLDKSQEEILRLEANVDQWREKYYDLRDEKQRVVTELTMTLERIKLYERQIKDDNDN